MGLEFQLNKQVQRDYEGILIAHPDATTEQMQSVFKKMKKVVVDSGGEWNHCDTWGKRRLANPIEKHVKAQYFHYTFKADSQAIKELQRQLRITESVLRFHHFRIDSRIGVKKHLEAYREVIQDSIQREKERAEKNEKKRQRRV